MIILVSHGEETSPRSNVIGEAIDLEELKQTKDQVVPVSKLNNPHNDPKHVAGELRIGQIEGGQHQSEEWIERKSDTTLCNSVEGEVYPALLKSHVLQVRDLLDPNVVWDSVSLTENNIRLRSPIEIMKIGVDSVRGSLSVGLTLILGLS